MFNFNKPEINTDPKKIEEVLTRNVEDIFVKENLKKKLESGKRLKIKLGFDPTGPKIHIGRAIVLHKLREFQDLGHEIIFLVGDFTARIGDPSDKLEKRPMLDSKKISENLRDYKKQIGKIVDLKKARFVYNNDWLSKLNFAEITELAESFTVSQMTSRRNFKERLDRGDEVSLREFLYPLMQGYDSYELKADVELGGFDQLFNLKAGRVIQKHYGMAEQDIIATIMLEGTDGRKMSTSWGNVINTTDSANEMFGKTMSLHDDLIVKYLKACTKVSSEKISEIEKGLADESMNPRDAKIFLAKELVKIYHDEKSADLAEENFVKTFSEKGGMPDDAAEISVSAGDILVDALVEAKIVDSKSDWRRLVESGAVTNLATDEKISEVNFTPTEDVDLKVGKKRFIRVRVK